jgi:protocatechuate 3,4-dioxygenase beta subunit
MRSNKLATQESADKSICQPSRRRMLSAFGALSALPLLAELASKHPISVAQAASTTAAAPNIDQQGLTGAWYDPATIGQGFVIEVLPDQAMIVGAWYTYDITAGDVTTQRWYTFSGSILDGATSAAVTVYQTTGGNFAAAPVTYAVVAGSATLSFDSCASASFVFSLTDGRSGTIALVRGLANVACTSADTAGSGNADFALSGTWYNATTGGQGILLEVNSATPYVFLSWFTYALSGETSGAAGQRWFTAQSNGYAAGDHSINLTLYTSTNGTFNSSATTVSTVAVGSATLTYSSCGAAVLSYAFTSGEFSGKSGDITLQRTGATPSACIFGGSCALIPADEIGPFPLSSILSNAAIVRSDITETKTGIPLKLILRAINVNSNCAPINDAAVYIWHCDKDGVYSGYSGQTDGDGGTSVSTVGQTYLRGVQVSDSSGQVVFDTIYPGWYAGRITHIHVQVFLNDALNNTAVITTQIAFPEDITEAVYATSLYTPHGENTSIASNAADHVFSDGTTYQLLTLTGDTSSGYVGTLTLGIAG